MSSTFAENDTRVLPRRATDMAMFSSVLVGCAVQCTLELVVTCKAHARATVHMTLGCALKRKILKSSVCSLLKLYFNTFWVLTG